MGNDDQPQSYRRAGPRAARLFKRRNHTIQRTVLTEEQNLVFALKVVVKIRRGQLRGARNVAHSGFHKSARTEFSSRRAQNLQPSRLVSPLLAAVPKCLGPVI
jgi:hypothetical protein